MWLFTTTGFYSINRAPGGERLQLRARRAEDLDRFRERWCPALSETKAIEGTDYQFRAEVEPGPLGAAIMMAVHEIDYKNFKDAVGHDDSARSLAYLDVWSALLRLGDRRGDGEEVRDVD